MSSNHACRYVHVQCSHVHTALCSSLGSLEQIVKGKKTLEISGTVYIIPLIGVHCYTLLHLSQVVFLPLTICHKLPSELQRAVCRTLHL